MRIAALKSQLAYTNNLSLYSGSGNVYKQITVLKSLSLTRSHSFQALTFRYFLKYQIKVSK